LFVIDKEINGKNSQADPFLLHFLIGLIRKSIEKGVRQPQEEYCIDFLIK